ncbi:hypothetical protein D6C84_08259 [Aureobasidium pullulans]|uniref:Tetraspanin Tsp3 n=1 Tax=Aureobasidium pullulans TaxID=5580 RepID=A0A4S9BHI4_AURPU|nr:hypothetical protein D6D15_02868 [Aureobasidium pullulans]THX06901.1 hypothetical protein D6D17_04868 [Aureobasidium pullulans]THX15763.1 hypothetical protein D6D13_02299 [Aureobasidium pullulans]THX27741.1 hypothetical protein D6D10_09381 [Aureobasidium pullulans]THX29495.1 hypothetical protein D6D12_04151 [Aureobasidium pullulans]
MVSLNRRQVSVILSVLYLGALTAMAAYAVHQNSTLSLPIPSTLTTLTLALAPFAGLCIETSTALASSLAQHPKLRHRHARNFPAVLLPSTLTILGLLVYITVVATLSGTHISPVGGLGCALREKWQTMFQHKSGSKIRTIQEALKCCGFRNVRDMPFPFPGHGIAVDTCEMQYGYHVGCEGAWRDKERTVAGLMIGVAVGVFVWVAIIIVTPALHPTWAQQSMRHPHRMLQDESDAANRVIEYPSQRYTDDPEGGDEDARREIDGLNNESRLALEVESSRDHPSKLLSDQGVWRGEDGRT